MDSSKKDFHHPFEPYDIQYELMKAIYGCIKARQVGIFESPTGTGKSLSLICGSLTWLRDFQDQSLDEWISQDKDDEEPEWVREHAKREKRKTIIEQRAAREAKLRAIRAKELRQRERNANGEPSLKKRKIGNAVGTSNADEEAGFLLDDYSSEDEDTSNRPAFCDVSGDGISRASLQLMERLGEMVPGPIEQELQSDDEVKIFYSSRTHSQLTQFVNEVRRVHLPAASWTDATDKSSPSKEEDQSEIKHVPLASRKNLCINPAVAKLGSAPAINERCLELQQRDTPKDRKCPYIPNKENETLVTEFRDHTLARIRDIEDLGSLGKTIGICPYYAARATIKPSEVVTLPYPLLLQKSAREALGISLKDHVLVIDEAHNLMDAIANINSVTITYSQLKQSKSLLNVYLQKFRNRLKGKNRIYIVQVIRLLDSIIEYLDRRTTGSHSTEGLVHISDLMAGKGVDQINLYKLMRYLHESKLARKVESYKAYIDEISSQAASGSAQASTPVLTMVQSFFMALTNPASEGCFFCERSQEGITSLKYTLLDPAPHFQDLVQEARAVILAGGTMSPMEDYVRHLFPYIGQECLVTWSCGHIIPKENLIVYPVAKGPNNVEFDFTYERRNLLTMIDALGSSLIELCASIPDGLVVFFPSYRYLQDVIDRWQIPTTGADRTIWTRISKRKPIFMESKESSAVEDVLHEYSRAIDGGKGGLLLSVIGGKMSEGINFSDRLGRGVVVVGLPFPNIQSAQWKAKLEYIEKYTIKQGGKIMDGKIAAQEFYENTCMRAVNQSIGRAIRHQKDYASIILLDRRYQTPRIESKLPGWIKQGLVHESKRGSWGNVCSSLEHFFESKTAR